MAMRAAPTMGSNRNGEGHGRPSHPASRFRARPRSDVVATTARVVAGRSLDTLPVMSISDPEQAGHEQDGEPDDAPLPTRFGRDRHRRRPRREPAARLEGASHEPRLAPDDAPPFEDDGGL
jgi:hypothetical protein